MSYNCKCGCGLTIIQVEEVEAAMPQFTAMSFPWEMYVGDSGDETAPAELNPVPIEEVYSKPIESEDKKRERLWKIVQEFSR